MMTIGARRTSSSAAFRCSNSLGQTVALNAANSRRGLDSTCCTQISHGEQALRGVERGTGALLLGVPTMYMGMLAVKNREQLRHSS
jgi:hypothetical protein